MATTVTAFVDTFGNLCDLATGEALRLATAAEAEASEDAASLDGGVGAIEVVSSAINSASTGSPPTAFVSIAGHPVTVTVTDAHLVGDRLVESAGQQWPALPVSGDFDGAVTLAEAIARHGDSDGVIVVIETAESRERIAVAC